MRTFATIQFLIAFGIVWKRSTKAALGLSIVWALGVWWFGEGAGGIFLGGATPFGGGPGGVLFYAVLAVLLWPSEGSDEPFVAARTSVSRRPRASGWRCGDCWRCWRSSARAGHRRHCTTWWPSLTMASPAGSPTSTGSPRRSSSTTEPPPPILLAVVCVVVAVGVFLPPQVDTGDPGRRHGRVRRDLGGGPELRRHPRRRGDRSELGSPRPAVRPRLLAPGR